MRLGTLSEDLYSPISTEKDKASSSWKLGFLYTLSDYSVKILWPTKRGENIVTGHQMYRVSIKSKSIIDKIIEHKVKEIDLMISLVEMPVKEGGVRKSGQVVRCKVKIKDPQK